MKKILLAIVLLIGIVALAGLIAAGCGRAGSGGSASTHLFYDSTTNTTPVFNPRSATASSVKANDTTTWGSGNPLYSVYYSLREFVSPRDEGVVDRSNLYKLLIDVDSVFSGLAGTVSSITTQEVTPPFASLEAISCNQAYNDTSGKRAIAMTGTSLEANAIISWIWGSGTQEEYGIASISLNKVTQDITVDMVYSVDYNLSDTATDYNLRGYVTGNAGTHAFQYKYLIGDNAIVAKGISKGSGNNMLLKYKGSDNITKYIVATAEAGESYFYAQNTSPTNIYSTSEVGNLPSTVASYKTWVVDTPFFTSAEVVTNLNQLNIGNSRAGTIYIKYN